MTYELRTGQWEEVLADVSEVDAIITDPPYSERTHKGHDAGTTLANGRTGKGWSRGNGKVDAFRERRELSYSHWTSDDVQSFVSAWAPRCNGWFVALSDSELCGAWRSAFEANGLTGFHPVPLCIPGMTCRFSGDGPASWAVYLNVARPKALAKWGALPGFYLSGQGERGHIGGKPLEAMRKIVAHYSRAGDLVCDPCAGAGTTLLAALMEGRHAIGAEVDESTAAQGIARIQRDYTVDLFSATQARRTCSKCRGTFRMEAFAVDRGRTTGHQSWCRRCKADWEHGPENSWKRTRAWLERDEPSSLSQPHGWTESLYLKHWEECGGACGLCGARLREWQASGHNLDRIDNSTPHIPANCRMVCWPCNKTKRNRNALAADAEIRRYVEQYGRGKVPWQLLYPEFKRAEVPDVEQYRVIEAAVQRSMFDGASP